MTSVAVLRGLSLFADVPDDQLEALAKCFTLRSYPKGSFIFHKDVPGDALYIIRSGRIRVFLSSEDGEEFTINTYGPGEVFGEMSVFDGWPRSASVAALEPTTVFRLDRADFAPQLASSPPLVRALVNILVQRLRYTTSYAGSLAFLDVNARVAARLLELAERYGEESAVPGSIELYITQADLASRVAASRERVNKVLASLRRRGLIETRSNSTILILDKRGLQHASWGQ
jgi:CRP-like cAMP-binding protein